MSTATLTAPNEADNQFNWPLCYEAENLLLERIEAFLAQNSFARILSERMRAETVGAGALKLIQDMSRESFGARDFWEGFAPCRSMC